MNFDQLVSATGFELVAFEDAKKSLKLPNRLKSAWENLSYQFENQYPRTDADILTYEKAMIALRKLKSNEKHMVPMGIVLTIFCTLLIYVTYEIMQTNGQDFSVMIAFFACAKIIVSYSLKHSINYAKELDELRIALETRLEKAWKN